MDSINMDMNQTSFEQNYKIGLLKHDKAIEVDDRRNGVDLWLDHDIPIAFRKRPHLSINDYNGRVITIRIGKPEFRGYINFEYDKLLDGQFKSIIYIFRLKDNLLICSTQSIIDYLNTYKLSELDIKPNIRGQSDLIAIHPNELRHILITPLYSPMNLS